MLTILGAVGVLLVIFAVAVFATREDQALQEAPVDVADVALPEGPLRAEDVAALRFGVTVRGYRMAEVDAALDRLARELSARDAQLAAAAVDGPAAPGVPPAPYDEPYDEPHDDRYDGPYDESHEPGPPADQAAPEARRLPEDFPDVLPAEPAGGEAAAPRD